MTVPIGRRKSLFVAWTREHGLNSVVWRKTCGDLRPLEDDPDDLGGVREPRKPRSPLRGGAVALPFDPPL